MLVLLKDVSHHDYTNNLREGYEVETVHVTSLAARQVDTKICRNCIQLSELE